MARFIRGTEIVDAERDADENGEGGWIVIHGNGEETRCSHAEFVSRYRPLDREEQLQMLFNRNKPLVEASIEDLLFELMLREKAGELQSLNWNQSRAVVAGDDGRIKSYPPSFNVITFIRLPKGDGA